MLIRWLPLSLAEKHLLSALLQGAQLKAHRYLDGAKVHKLHDPELTQESVIADDVVKRLQGRGYIQSNMKFPTATYVLTDSGKVKGLSFVDWSFAPVTSHQ